MTFQQAISDGFAKFTDFSSRSSRSAYWWWVLFVILVEIAVAIVDLAIGTYPVLYLLTALVLLVPNLAVTVRRLHDVGKSGWWVLIGLIPFGFIVLIVFALQESQGPNQWGEGPDVPATA